MKEINALDLRKHFGQIMDEVRYRKEPCVIKKNGRPVIVLVDFDVYKSSQESLREEAFIEEYTKERIREFLEEDRLDKAALAAARKRLSK